MRLDYGRVRAAALSAILCGVGSALAVPAVGAITLGTAMLISTPARSACMGTHRTIRLDPSRGNFYNGLEKSLGLRDGEVILTFDDGPKPGTTTRILSALSDECVRATFFMSGRMAKAYPSLAARVRREGHTVASHTHGHENLAKLGSAAVSSTIDRGEAAIRAATGARSMPFFRYPYLARSPRTDAIVRRKGLIAFGTNIDSKDYKKVSAATVVSNTMAKLHRQRKGIILMHDIHARTASAVPMLLDRLKAEGFRIVHMVPGRGVAPALVASATPDPQVRGTEATLALARTGPRAASRATKPGVVISGSSKGERSGRRNLRPVIAAAFTRAEDRRKGRAARLDVLKRGSVRGSDKPMTAAQKLRARYAIRKQFRVTTSLPMHTRGRAVVQLKRR